MATTNTTGLYAFDPYGNHMDNLIIDEGHALQIPGRDDYYFIIPRAAPFFATTLQIKSSTGVVYQEGVDYLLGHTFVEATHQTGRAVSGSVRFLRRDITGMVYLRYQTLGGEWGFDSNAVLQELSNKLVNPLIRSWGQIDVLPNAFPPVAHDQSVDEMIGFPEVTKSLEEIRKALEASAAGATAQHINDYNNPHRVTAVQVGLGAVENLPVASVLESVEATRNDRYLTPARGRVLVNEIAIKPITQHVSNYDNPHQVTKTQVGLSNVENYATASIFDTVLGTSNSLYTTPKGVNEAIEGAVSKFTTGHFTDYSNPHQVTKTQVGLSNVENHATADVPTTVLGDSDTTFTTPRGVREAIQKAVGLRVTEHHTNYSNPHQVTKAQVGLSRVFNYGVANTTATVTGTADDLYTTPLGVREAITQALGGGNAADHFTDYSNPHQVTAAQVGTLTELQINEALDSKLNSDEASVDSEMVYGLRKNELLGVIAGMTVDNSARLDGNSVDDMLRLTSAAGINEQILNTVADGSFACVIKRGYDVEGEIDNVAYTLSYTGFGTKTAVGVLTFGSTAFSVQIQIFNDVLLKTPIYATVEDDYVSIWAQSTGTNESLSFSKRNGGVDDGVFFPTVDSSSDTVLPSLTLLNPRLLTIEYPLMNALTSIAEAFDAATSELK